MTRHAVATATGRESHPSSPSRGLVIGLALGLAAIGIAVLIALIAVLARGENSSSVSATATQAPAVASAGQQSAQSGEFKRLPGSVPIGYFLIAVTSVKTPTDIKPPEAHLKYVVIEISVQNVGTSSSTIRAVDDFTLFNSDGVKASILVGGDAESDALGDLGKRMRATYAIENSQVGAGQTLDRIVVFKILKDTSPARL